MRRSLTALATFASLSAGLALLAAACAAAPRNPESAGSPEAALRSLDSLWATMYATHDTLAADRLYGDDLVFRSANGSIKSKRIEMHDVRRQPGLVMDYFRTHPSAIRVEGDSATVAGLAEWRFTMNGQPREVRRTYEHRYARGGPLGWRIVRVRMGLVP